jgi:hypothetical protein
MDVGAVRSQIFSRRRNDLLAARPTIYILIVLGAVLTSYIYKLWADNIFACQASGYSSDRYLASCDVINYGDYEHGAFWFDLEPAAQASAASADVLFVGDSRLQFAFSTAPTEEWFSSAAARYYLLGFIDYENSIFEQALLRKLKPKAKVYVINIYEFFEPTEAPVAKIIMHDDGARIRYEAKRLWQFVHEPICMKLAKICGNGYAIFRSRQTGTWYMQGMSKFRGLDRPVSYDQSIDQHEVDDAVTIGRDFLSGLPVKPECVILTAIPTVKIRLKAADVIAADLGEKLVVPEHLDGLQTFDGSHLDHPSAERWSKAFFQVAGPQIQKCLDEDRTSRT